MRVRVDTIPPEGQTITAGDETGWAVRAAHDAVEGEVQAVRATLQIHATGHGHATVRVQAETRYTTVCDRCGEDLHRHLHTTVDLAYQPAGTGLRQQADDEGLQLEEDELDVGWYEDGSLALADVLTEALALALPSRTLCEDQAGCDARTDALLAAARGEQPGHPAFAALKNLLN